MICFVCGRNKDKDDIEVVYTPVSGFEFFICRGCKSKRRNAHAEV